MSENIEQLHLGIYLDKAESINECIGTINTFGCQFVAHNMKHKDAFLMYSDGQGDAYSWLNQSVTVLNDPCVEVENPQLEFEWAAHICSKYVLLGTELTHENVVETARSLSNQILLVPDFKGEIWIPVESKKGQCTLWSDFKKLSSQNERIFPVPIISEQADLNFFQGWIGSYSRCFIIETSAFQSNEEGLPCLGKRQLETLHKILKLGGNILLRGAFEKNWKQYTPFIEYVQKEHQKSCFLSQSDLLKQSYRDMPQYPLQPLRDNLQSGTYEVFERDSVKYVHYRKALLNALKDKSDEEEISVLVVGPGRGPLIKILISAAKELGAEISICAVEKNQFACEALVRAKSKNSDWDNVDLFSADIRTCELKRKFDIIVSELLGSFGDNELSPDILNVCGKFMKRGGTMIPQNYSSFLAPVADQILWQRIKDLARGESSSSLNLEIPYISYLFCHTLISEPKKCYQFDHPLKAQTDKEGILRKSVFVEFVSTEEAELHGFAGYFDSKLYGDIAISINPQSKTSEMDSWFPMFFPLRNPINVNVGDKIKLSFWRNKNRKMVWYEWCLTSPVYTEIQNLNGRAHKIGCELNS